MNVCRSTTGNDTFLYCCSCSVQGIFHTKFADQGSIPAADLGYAALAQGLGMVAGEPGGYFQPLANATRAQAATMLYNLMAH